MNKNYHCDIIKDLLPGYIDEVLSETSTKVVTEHLNECQECSRIYSDMKGELSIEINEEEQLALDGFRKIRQHTRKLKIAVGIVTGILVTVILYIFLRVYVFGEPLETGLINATDILYDEETDSLVINGTIDSVGYRISRVVWEESENEMGAINVFIYGAEILPFQPNDSEFSITIPNIKGQKVYIACPDFDQREVYDWMHGHYEKLDELTDEIYNRLPELDRNKDVVHYMYGIESVNGTDGILFWVDSVIGENATYWWYGDKIVTDGEFEPQNYEIWISLDEPYQIYIHDYKTGEYTERL